MLKIYSNNLKNRKKFPKKKKHKIKRKILKKKANVVNLN